MKYKYKRKLIRLLLQDKMRVGDVNREIIKKLFVFIDHLIKIPQQVQDKLIQDLRPLIEKEGVRMGLLLEDTSFAKYFKKEGIELGEKQKAIEIARRLLQNGLSVEFVSENTGLTMEELRIIQEAK